MDRQTETGSGRQIEGTGRDRQTETGRRRIGEKESKGYEDKAGLFAPAASHYNQGMNALAIILIRNSSKLVMGW